MVVDGFLKETRHFRPVLGDFRLNFSQERQMTHHWDKVDRYDASEQAKTFLNERHESHEPSITVMKSYAHYY